MFLFLLLCCIGSLNLKNERWNKEKKDFWYVFQTIFFFFVITDSDYKKNKLLEKSIKYKHFRQMYHVYTMHTKINKSKKVIRIYRSFLFSTFFSKKRTKKKTIIKWILPQSLCGFTVNKCYAWTLNTCHSNKKTM